jgi:transcriptional regulator with XRE-family HTH domain
MRKSAGVSRPRTVEPRNAELGALGRAIEQVITERKVTHEGLADGSGVDIKQVGSYIRGRGNPTYLTLRRLCRGLPVSLGELIAIAEELEEEHSS